MRTTKVKTKKKVQVRAKKERTRKGRTRKKRFQSIRTQLFGLLILSLFSTVALGVISYMKASSALSSSYITSTTSTIEAVADYFNTGMGAAKTNLTQFYNADQVIAYHDDTYYNDALAAKNAILAIKKSYTEVTSVDTMCQSIHSISSTSKLVSSDGQADGGTIYEDIKAMFEENNSSIIWISNHESIDDALGLDSNSYAVSYGMQLFGCDGYILADISASEITNYLDEIQIGERGILSFVVDDQKEFYGVNSEGENDLIADQTMGSGFIYNQSFYTEAKESEESSGSSYVTLEGESYLFIYSKVGDTGVMITGLIPNSVITGQASAIRMTTIVIASVILLLIVILGTIVTRRMKKSMKMLTDNLDQLATGDFTVAFNQNNADEFGVISNKVGDTVSNLRTLIGNMQQMNEQVANSTMYVTGIANDFATSSEEISEALQEVATDVVKEANDADNCLGQMNQLSTQVQEVYDGTTKISTISSETSDVVSEGITVVNQLAHNMKDSASMTKVVIDNVENLSVQSRSIEMIVDVINGIAEETNLLSLNASIEAARAGDAGRGFVVVADQVRKLADQSVEQVVEIGKIVTAIQSKTEETVTVAKKTEEYVKIQEDSLHKTVEMFDHIRSQFDMLIQELTTITDGIENIEEAKSKTLSSVKNISTYTQETSAVTEEVSATALTQIENVGKLREKIKILEEESNSLNEAVSKFNV